MKSPSGKILTSVDDILENWATFYENLYFSHRKSFVRLAEYNDDPIPPVMLNELEYAIKKLKTIKHQAPMVSFLKNIGHHGWQTKKIFGSTLS